MIEWKNITELTIFNENWARGKASGSTKLLDGHGNMCCLGFLALAMGATRGDIQEVVIPSNMVGGVPALLDSSPPRGFVTKAVGINDDPGSTDEARERLLKRLFAEHGIVLEFKDTENADRCCTSVEVSAPNERQEVPLLV